MAYLIHFGRHYMLISMKQWFRTERVLHQMLFVQNSKRSRWFSEQSHHRQKQCWLKTMLISLSCKNTNETSNVDAIIFQNYYCSSLSIAQQNSLQEYVTIVDNFVLMDDAHSEEKSQSWFTLPSSLFRSTYVPGRSMRFTLYQPDTTWQRFEIHNIRFVTATERSTTPTKNINLNNFNLLQVIESDWCLLNEATQAQKNIVEMPPITFTMAEYKKSIKKKEKKKDKKGSIAQPANDDFGIAIPTFPKNSELPDNV